MHLTKNGRALAARAHDAPQPPAWIAFPSERLWTLAHLARPFRLGVEQTAACCSSPPTSTPAARRSLVNLFVGAVILRSQ
jgi:hypothetical protein